MKTSWQRSLAVLLACAAILFARKPDAILNSQFWAEDGTVYFTDARDLGIRSLFALHGRGHVPYLVQRCIALAGNAVPVRGCPHWYVLACLAGTLAVCSVVSLRMKCGWPLALAIVLVPHDGEVFLNLANLHWILALLLIMLAIGESPATLGGKAAELLAVGVLSLTGPFALLFLPLFIGRLLRHPDRQSGLVLAVVAFCSGWSLGVLNPERTAGSLNLSDPGWRALIESWPSIAVVVTLAVALLARDWKCWAVAYAGAVVWLSPIYAHRYDPSIPASMGLSRYGYVPTVCFLWCLIFTWERRRWLRPVCVLLGCLTFAVATKHFFAAPLADLHWAEASRCIGGPQPCDVPINPVDPATGKTWLIHYRP